MILQKIIEVTFKTMTTKFAAALIVGSVAAYVALETPTNEENEGITDEVLNAKSQSPKLGRWPSSTTKSKAGKHSPTVKSSAKITPYNQSNFVEPHIKDSAENEIENGRNYSRPGYQSLISNVSNYEPTRQDAKNNTFAAGERKPANKVTEPDAVFRGTFTKAQVLNPAVKKEVPPESVIASSKYSTSIIEDNTCSTNIVGGAFGNPIGITLNCSYPSTIKYCLSDSTCCDPESSGSTYNSQVVIGPKNGTYCLSFIGDSPLGGSSVVYQQSYTINSTFPDLNVGHTKIFYQTTELEGTSFINSQDFGKDNFSIGQINLKSHDPGPDGLNYECEEIIANYVNFPAPAPIDVFSMLDLTAINVNSQVEIPLSVDQLEYGDNFITSYIKNNSYVAPLYSCATTKVNLEDFEYFQVDSSQSMPGTDSVREFEGEFATYGFFENLELARGPAGENSNDNSGQNLKSGLYGIFY